MSRTITFSITGLHCASCVGRAEAALSAVPGVTSAQVNLASETAQMQVADDDTFLAARAALETAGYPAATSQADLTITGLHCASCVGRAESALRAVPGVTQASVNLASETAKITYVEGVTTPAQLAQAVTDAGYTAHVTNSAIPRVDRKAAESTALQRAALIAGILTLPVLILEMGSHLSPAFHHWIQMTISMRTSWLIQFALATVVLAGPGAVFFRLGVPSLLRGAPEMNALVALGTASAWGFSTVALFAPNILPEGTQAIYFEAAAVICTLILLGRALEARAKGRTGAAITRLIGLRPATARVETDAGPVERPLADVIVGDRLHIRPGERVPVDGTVVSGDSFVDQSMISGEPVPIHATPGTQVIGGTVNGTGALVMEARAVGRDTVLAQVIDMVQTAQGAKLPVQALVDRVTGVFVPVVMGLAAITIGIWLIFGPDPALGLALVSGVSVLIIACPCAMGLATPTSIMVGSGRAADLGVLFRKGEALQRLEKISTIAFDKTGTLTEGRPELTTLTLREGLDRDTVLAQIAAVESQSEHPIAQAICRAADGLPLLKATKFSATPGMGASALVDGKTIQVGAARFMAQLGVTLDLDGPFSPAETPLYAAIDGHLVAAIGVSDRIKDSTPAAIASLREMGLRVAMITGDAASTADAVAAKLGIDIVVSDCLPADKTAALERLRADGPLAFVGDGINDAPALALADVGLAIGTGTDIAMEAADVVLMSGDLGGVARAVAISRATMRNIRQNLFWAFAYNTALIPVAMGALYPVWGVMLSPMLAGGAMALSSVFVVTNALRLRRA